MLEPKRFHQLFLDDGAIESSERITRRLHRPKKCGPLIPGGVQSRNSPQWNPDKQVWECGGTSADPSATRPPRTGNTGTCPTLGLYEWEGSRRNNLAADPDGDRGERPYHLLRDDDDPDPQRRYKGLLATWGRQPALSPDGFRWTPTGAPAIPSSDESQFTWDPYSRQYLAMVKQGTEWGRSVFLSTADADFREFSEPKLIFHSDETDHENCRQRCAQDHRGPGLRDPGRGRRRRLHRRGLQHGRVPLPGALRRLSGAVQSLRRQPPAADQLRPHQPGGAQRLPRSLPLGAGRRPRRLSRGRTLRRRDL